MRGRSEKVSLWLKADYSATSPLGPVLALKPTSAPGPGRPAGRGARQGCSASKSKSIGYSQNWSCVDFPRPLPQAKKIPKPPDISTPTYSKTFRTGTTF